MEITVTDAASVKIAEIREKENVPDDQRLRVAIRGGGCAGFNYELFFDETKDRDREIDSNGALLVVDDMSFMYVVGLEIDYVTTMLGAGFKFNNPNVKSTCGCGTSFSV